ncbi:protein mei2-like 4 [Anaeramoeba ignava]|uniref:Protein mei2-like 4 n=1 Tax=Anaeramoeba ignava TaxID=1746090 RepID=A0A9Q0R6K7_ANAIG|nr:protein mei2-like 4 [Anaeramoeba ignava]
MEIIIHFMMTNINYIFNKLKIKIKLKIKMKIKLKIKMKIKLKIKLKIKIKIKLKIKIKIKIKNQNQYQNQYQNQNQNQNQYQYQNQIQNQNQYQNQNEFNQNQQIEEKENQVQEQLNPIYYQNRNQNQNLNQNQIQNLNRNSFEKEKNEYFSSNQRRNRSSSQEKQFNNEKELEQTEFHLNIQNNEDSEKKELPAKIKTTKTPTRVLFIRNIAFEATKKDVEETFKKYGDIKLIHDLITKRGLVFVIYYDLRAAMVARRRLQDFDICGRKIDIHFSISYPVFNSETPNHGQLLLALKNTRRLLRNKDVEHLFTVWGEIRRIQDYNNDDFSKILEYYDTRATDKAIKKANRRILNGRLEIEYFPDKEEDYEGERTSTQNDSDSKTPDSKKNQEEIPLIPQMNPMNFPPQNIPLNQPIFNPQNLQHMNRRPNPNLNQYRSNEQFIPNNPNFPNFPNNQFPPQNAQFQQNPRYNEPRNNPQFLRHFDPKINQQQRNPNFFQKDQNNQRIRNHY